MLSISMASVAPIRSPFASPDLGPQFQEPSETGTQTAETAASQSECEASMTPATESPRSKSVGPCVPRLPPIYSDRPSDPNISTNTSCTSYQVYPLSARPLPPLQLPSPPLSVRSDRTTMTTSDVCSGTHPRITHTCWRCERSTVCT